ncbi:MAG: MerR family transcriptional regulator [Pseudomonadota bacterium]
MARYTVKQLGILSGVSVRTLHHYDEIGLLRPQRSAANGYRYYGRDEQLRLQQILFHRELGIPLQAIAALLDRPDFDRVATLLAHRVQLQQQARRYDELIATIDRTIQELQGNKTMQHADLYKGFSAEKQAKYEQWLVDRYGEDMRSQIAASSRTMAATPPEALASRTDELAAVEGALADCCRRKLPVDAVELQPLLGRHRAWVALMWNRPCPPAAYAGLAELYLSHPDFRARYETLQSGFAQYLADAMRGYAAQQPADG